MIRAQADRSEDKKYLQNLSDSLKTSYSKIKLDGCGDWNIIGQKGFINTDTKFWYIYPDGKSLENRLSFMEKRMNGLSFRSDSNPTAKQAEIIRKVLGLS